MSCTWSRSHVWLILTQSRSYKRWQCWQVVQSPAQYLHPILASLHSVLYEALQPQICGHFCSYGHPVTSPFLALVKLFLRTLVGGLLEVLQSSFVPALLFLLVVGSPFPVLSGLDQKRNPTDLILYGCQLRKTILGRENKNRCLGC